MNKIGQKIKLVRQRSGLSQENMAEQLNISQPSYARLERDDSKISITKLITIAKILDVSVCDFFENGCNHKQKETNNTLIQQLKDEIKFLRKMIKK